ncbi:MAG: class I SAM-dependent methyltransferase [Gammaproteobacteria bacterium]|jgi:SAM-dependent methyltransferase
MNANDFSDERYLEKIFRLQCCDEDNRGGRSLKNVKLHIKWLTERLLHGKNNLQILDIGCGIGHYTRELAIHGHHSIGIDISHYAIDYAKKTTPQNLNCQFMVTDITKEPLPQANDLIIFPYSIFNIFNKTLAQNILYNIRAALNPRGIFYLEVMKYINLDNYKKYRAWSAKKDDFYCAHDHTVLNKNIWNTEEKTLEAKYFFISNIDFSVDTLKNTIQFYQDDEYVSLLQKAGFECVEYCGTPPGADQDPDLNYISFISYS